MGGSESRIACGSVKRADSAVKDDKDTDAMRAKLCDTPSSSSSKSRICANVA